MSSKRSAPPATTRDDNSHDDLFDDDLSDGDDARTSSNAILKSKKPKRDDKKDGKKKKASARAADDAGDAGNGDGDGDAVDGSVTSGVKPPCGDQDMADIDEGGATAPPQPTRAPSTAVVAAPNSRTTLAVARYAARDRLKAIYGTKSTGTSAPRSTNGDANYAKISGYVLSVHDNEAAKVSNTAFVVAVTSIERSSHASLVQTSTSANPTAALLVPSFKIGRASDDMTDARGNRKPDHRVVPEAPRFTRPGVLTIKCNRMVSQKPGDRADVIHKRVESVRIGSHVCFDSVEYSIPKTESPETGRVYFENKGDLVVKTDPGVGEHDPFAIGRLMRKLANQAWINHAAFDTFVDLCGGFMQALYAADYDADAVAKRHTDDTPLGKAAAGVAERMRARQEAVAKGLEVVIGRFDANSTAETTVERYRAIAKQLASQVGESAATPPVAPLHVGLGDGDDTPSIFVLHTRRNRLETVMTPGDDDGLTSALAAMPSRFVEYFPSGEIRTFEGKNGVVYAKLDMAACLVPNADEAHRLLETEGDEAAMQFCPMTAPPDSDGPTQPRLTVTADIAQWAAAVGVTSKMHLTPENLWLLLTNAYFSATLTPKNRAGLQVEPTIQGFAESIVVDMPGALRLCGVPVSGDWVRENICKGGAAFPGIVMRNAKEITKNKISPYSYKAEPWSPPTLDVDGFVNVTESLHDPLIGTPEGCRPRYVVIMANERVQAAVEDERRRLNVEDDALFFDEQGEEILDQELAHASNNDADNMPDLLQKYNAIVYAVLESATNGAGNRLLTMS